MKKWFNNLKKKFVAWLTPILDNRYVRLAMWIIPVVSIILQFILSKFPGRFAAVMGALTLAYWIFWGSRSKGK